MRFNWNPILRDNCKELCIWPSSLNIKVYSEIIKFLTLVVCFKNVGTNASSATSFNFRSVVIISSFFSVSPSFSSLVSLKSIFNSYFQPCSLMGNPVYIESLWSDNIDCSESLAFFLLLLLIPIFILNSLSSLSFSSREADVFDAELSIWVKLSPMLGRVFNFLIFSWNYPHGWSYLLLLFSLGFSSFELMLQLLDLFLKSPFVQS